MQDELSPPGPATPYSASRLAAIALAVGVGLLAPPARCVRRASMPHAWHAALAPQVDAADVVGIYQGGACTLILDASGTYRDDCGDGQRRPYTIEGHDVVLVGPGWSRHLKIAAGSLVDESGLTFLFTEGVR